MATNELCCAVVVGGGHGAGIAVDAVNQPRVQVLGCFDSVLLCCWLGQFVICEIDAGSIGFLLLTGLVKSMPDHFFFSFVASYPTEHTRDKIRIDYVTVRG